MNRIARWYWIARALGPGNLQRRLRYAIKARTGYFRRRLPAGEPDEATRRAAFVDGYHSGEAPRRWETRAATLFGSPKQLNAVRAALGGLVSDQRWTEHVSTIVDELGDGDTLYFSHRYLATGWPPRFNHDAMHGVEWPTGRHWTSYRQFDPALADIKLVWEPSRFASAFVLARDAVRRDDPAPGRLFWEMLDAWDTQNPFGATVAWSNGQECAFRAMAWIFSASLLRESATPGALHRLTELIAYSGALIETAIDYARGQKNNHAISEAAALWTFGVLFPELHAAPRWREMGRRILAEEAERQVYPDGSYVQHSLGYHRVALDGMTWAMWVGRRAGDSLREVEAPAARALDWLITMIEPSTGDVPNYGPNDGSRVLPLSCTVYRDFRPTAQALHVMLRGTRAFPAGAWDEAVLWLSGPGALDSAVADTSALRARPAPDGGYYPMRGPRTWGLIRIHEYRDRPAESDMLHLDWWADGSNMLRDGGTYLYFTDPVWQRWFRSAAAHNTVEVDGRDQMEPGPNFLWFRWTKARVLRRESAGDVDWIEGEHYGYRRQPGTVVHRRGVLRIRDSWLVVDDVFGQGEHEVALRWRLHPGGWRVASALASLEATDGGATVRVTSTPSMHAQLSEGVELPAPEGWESRHYADRTPAPTIVARRSGALPVRFVTTMAPGNEAMIEAIEGTGEPAGPVRIAAGMIDPVLIERVTGGSVTVAGGR